MVEKHVTPTIASASFHCPHCGVLTHQTWYNLLASQMEGKGLPELPLPDPAKVLAASLAALQTPRAKPPSPDAFRPKQAFVGGTLMADTHCPKVENLFASVCYTCGAVSIWVGERLMFPPARHGEEPNVDLP